MRELLLPSLTLLLSSLARAADNSTGYMQSSRSCAGGAICLTSFEWCSGSGACDYPDDVLPLRATDQSGDGLGGLDPSGTYDVSWTDGKDGEEVVIEWVLGEGNSTASDDEVVLWTTTTKSNPYQFKPSSIIAKLSPTAPATNSNTTSTSIPFTAPVSPGSASHLRITQTVSGSNKTDVSQPFLLVDADAMDAYAATRFAAGKESANQAWSIGVGVTAGIGGTIVLVGAVWATRRYYMREINMMQNGGAYGMVGNPMARAAGWAPGMVGGGYGMMDQYGNPLMGGHRGSVGYAGYM